MKPEDYVTQARAGKLYNTCDTVLQWLAGCTSPPKNHEGNQLPLDPNELASTLNGVDDDWLFNDLIHRLDQLSAIWNMAKMTGDDELFNQVGDAVDALVGIHVDIMPTTNAEERRTARLKKRLQSLEDERQRILSILEHHERE